MEGFSSWLVGTPSLLNISIVFYRKGPAMYLDGRLLWFDARLQPVVTLPNGSYPAHFDFQNSYRKTTLHNDFTETLAVTQQIRQQNRMMVVPRNIDVKEIKVGYSWTVELFRRVERSLIGDPEK